MIKRHYTIGQKVRLTATFTDIDGNAIDPGGVTFSYKPPGEDMVTLVYDVDDEPERHWAGVYYLCLYLDKVGTWPYFWRSTEPGRASHEGRIVVQRSQFEDLFDS